MLDTKKLHELLEEKLFPIKEWLNDSSVTEIMINPEGHTFVEANGVKHSLGMLFSESTIEMTLVLIAKMVHQDAIAHSLSSIIGATVGDMRIAGAIKPVSPQGSFLTIRIHKAKKDRPTLEDLVNKYKALTQEQADTIIDLVVNKKMNLIVAGATGSGKTTVTNAILSRIPKTERIVTIEDSRELQLDCPDWVPLLSNPTSGVLPRDLVQLAMRLYPGRLILGETRGNETYDLIRAFNSGHDGSISTVHSSSAESALFALEMLFQMNLPAGASMPPEVVRQYIARSINLVVYAGRRDTYVDGVVKVVRKIEQICLIKGVKNGNYELENL